LEDTFRKGIANALGVSIEDVVKLTVTEVGQGQGSRRLQATQSTRYEVSYEVLPPSSMDADAVVEKANLILESNSDEAQVFRQALTETSGVAEVGEIEATVPPRKFEDQVTTIAPHNQGGQHHDESSGMSPATVVLLVCAVPVCLVAVLAGSFLLKRKMDAQAAKEEVDAEAGCNPAPIRTPSHTLLDSNGKDAKQKPAWKLPFLNVEGA
jgi:hypothetical protein